MYDILLVDDMDILPTKLNIQPVEDALTGLLISYILPGNHRRMPPGKSRVVDGGGGPLESIWPAAPLGRIDGDQT